MPTAAILRPATPQDLPAIAAIYTPEILEGTATFELDPPGLPELAARLERVRNLGLPWLVAEIGGKVEGYAYAAPHHQRPGYRFTVEDSVYVARRAQGRGLGRQLLEGILAEARAAGMRQMVAVIGDSANSGSIRLHAACGFVHVGTLTAVGWKFGRWLDTVLMQRAL